MKAFTIFLVAVFVGLGLLAYFVWPWSGDQMAEEIKTVVGEATFVCPGGPTLDTTFYSGGTMDMVIEGVASQLTIATSASGARYLNEEERLEFWEHQGKAHVTIDGQVYNDCVTGEADNRYITEEIVNGQAISFTPPPGSKISVEREVYYKVLFAGPQNEPPALTDGYTITMTLLDMPDNAEFEAFVEEQRDLIEPPIEAALSPVEVNGRQGFAFTYETALGTTATDTFLRMAGDTVVHVSVSSIGENAASYQADIDNTVESIVLVPMGS